MPHWKKTRERPHVLRKVSSSDPTSGIRRITLVTTTVIIHDWGPDNIRLHTFYVYFYMSYWISFFLILVGKSKNKPNKQMNVKVNNLKRTDSSVVRLWVQHFCCFVFFCFFVFNHCCSDKGGIYKQDINIEVKHPQFPQCKTSRQTLLKWSSWTWNKNYENGKKNYENATLNQIHHYLLLVLLEVQIKTCIESTYSWQIVNILTLWALKLKRKVVVPIYLIVRD